MRELGSQIADRSVGSQQSLKHKARGCECLTTTPATPGRGRSVVSAGRRAASAASSLRRPMTLTPGGRQAVCVARRAARPRLIELLAGRAWFCWFRWCLSHSCCLFACVCVSVCLSCRCVSRGPEGSKGNPNHMPYEPVHHMPCSGTLGVVSWPDIS